MAGDDARRAVLRTWCFGVAAPKAEGALGPLEVDNCSWA